MSVGCNRSVARFLRYMQHTSVKAAAVKLSCINKSFKLFTLRSRRSNIKKLKKYNNKEHSTVPSAVMKGHSCRHEDHEDNFLFFRYSAVLLFCRPRRGTRQSMGKRCERVHIFDRSSSEITFNIHQEWSRIFKPRGRRPYQEQVRVFQIPD